MRIFPKNLQNHWSNPKGLIQDFIGPRQVGKTTAAVSLMDKSTTIFASADLPAPPTVDFIVENWRAARAMPSESRTLILDEIQKIPRWSEVVKACWDDDVRNNQIMRVCLLGSAALLMLSLNFPYRHPSSASFTFQVPSPTRVKKFRLG
jgi:uncharacterized protein